MPKSFRERWWLKRLSMRFNRHRFKEQNTFLSSIVQMAPEWFHQSRSNYTYIYTNLDAYWPEWMIRQFDPYNPQSVRPINALSCLNYTMPPVFRYSSPSPYAFSLCESGIIYLTHQLWALRTTYRHNNTHYSLLPVSHIQFNTTRHCIESALPHPSGAKITTAFACTDTIFSLSIIINNPTNTPQTISLNIGALPMTVDGVGHISHLQFTSDHQLVINNASQLQSSEPPSNIICTQYTDGTIYSHDADWKMILSQKCPHGLASGLLTFDRTVSPNDTQTLTVSIHYHPDRIIPLLPSIPPKKNRLTQQLPPTCDPVAFPSPNTSLRLLKSPPTMPQLNALLTNYTVRIPYADQTHSIPSIVYTLQTHLRLYDVHNLNRFFDNYTLYEKKLCPQPFAPLFSASQARLLLQGLVIMTCERYHYPIPPSIHESFKKKLQTFIRRDPFTYYIAHHRFEPLPVLGPADATHQVIIKVISLSLILNHFASYISKKSQQIQRLRHWQTYYQRLVHHAKKLSSLPRYFYQTKSLSTELKLFLLNHCFILPDLEPIKTACVTLFSKNIIDGHMYDPTDHSRFSELYTLLLTPLLPPSQQQSLLTAYLNRINPLGTYVNRHSFYQSFTTYPRYAYCYHNVFLSLFFDLIVYEQNNALIIDCLNWTDSLSIQNLNTPFGLLSIEVVNHPTCCITLRHHFHQPPLSIELRCPDSYKHYTFDPKTTSRHPIEKTISIPLNKSSVFMYT